MMNNFNFFSFSSLLIIVTNAPLLYFLLKNLKNKTTKLFSLQIFCVLGWGLLSFFISIINNDDIVLLLCKISLIVVIFISIFASHTILLHINKNNPIFILFTYLQGIIFSLLVLFGYSITHVTYKFNEFYYFNYDSFFFITFIFWLSIVIYSHTLLFQYYFKRKNQYDNSQLSALLLSTFGFIGGIFNFISGFDVPIYPIGNAMIPIHSLCIFYAIFRHNLFIEVRSSVQKGLGFSLLIAVLTLTYVAVVFSLEKYLQIQFQYSSLTLSLVLSFALGVLILPLKNKIEILLNKIIFNASQQEIYEQNINLKNQLTESEKHKLLSNLSSNIAHEIKNPLTSIMTFAEYLPEKLMDKNYLKNYSKIISEESRRINGLVEQLLNFSKPSTTNKEFIHISEVINSTSKLIDSQLKNKNISYQIKFINDIELYIDPQKIKQALLNILLNAIDAVSSENGKILLKTEKINFNGYDCLEIKIFDNGPGIKPEDLAIIFNPFVTKKEKGTGLGLAITKNIVEKHGGSISVKYSPSFHFSLKLPIVREE